MLSFQSIVQWYTREGVWLCHMRHWRFIKNCSYSTTEYSMILLLTRANLLTTLYNWWISSSVTGVTEPSSPKNSNKLAKLFITSKTDKVYTSKFWSFLEVHSQPFLLQHFIWISTIVNVINACKDTRNCIQKLVWESLSKLCLVYSGKFSRGTILQFMQTGNLYCFIVVHYI